MHVNRRLDIVPSIQWHEGMFLGPQHFQQQDLRVEQIFSHQLHLLSYCHYGVHNLKLDPIMIPNGVIRILALEAVMPDGLIINFTSGQYGLDLECDIKQFHKKNGGKEFLIQLALAERIEDRSSLSEGLSRNLSIDGEEIKDDNTNDNPIAIPRLIPKLFLHIGNNTPSKCLVLPLFKVELLDEVFVEKSFIPPCFFITKDMKLWEDCAEIARIIRAKASFLCDKWQNQIGTPMLKETSDRLKPLIAILPEMETLLHTHPVHPFVIHQLLCRVAGQIATLRLSQIPPILPPYQHNDILDSFTPIIELINKYILSLEQTYIEIPFKQKERLFYLRLQEIYKAEKLYVGLRVAKGMSEGQLHDWMQDAVITSDSTLEMIRIRRITGAERTLLQDEQLEELMPSRGILIFEIKVNSEYIHFDQNLHIFNPADAPDRRPTEICLYIRQKLNP